MSRAFEQLDFRQSYPFFMLARVVPREIYHNKQDVRILAACLKDCVIEFAKSGCSRNLLLEIKRGLVEVAHTSVVEAHLLFVSIVAASKSLEARQAARVGTLMTQGAN